MRPVPAALLCMGFYAQAIAQEVTVSPTLQAREFFDAVVPLEAVEAILVRTKQ
jgi:hypothetical protein